MVRFDYLEPTSIRETLALLAKHGIQAKVLAGGTDLLKRLKEHTLQPRFVVNIKRLSDLEGIVPLPGQGIKIGALTTMHSLEQSTLVRERYPALAEAAHALGSPQVRNLATIGGNLCNAAPSAETAPSLIAVSASVRIVGHQGERAIPLESFFTGPGTTELQEGEILTEILLPGTTPGTGSSYLKHCPRGSLDVAIVGVAAMVQLNPSGVIEECRIALGAVAPVPLRAKKSETHLRGNIPDSMLIQKAAQEASEEAMPISDVRGSAEYRRNMVRVMTMRALQCALERAGQRLKREGKRV